MRLSTSHSSIWHFISTGALLACMLLGTAPSIIVAKELSPQGETKADDPKIDRQARLSAQKQLKQLGLLMHVHHNSFNRFPDPAILDGKGNALLSWRVAILPLLDDPKAQQLHSKFHLNEPWDSEHNTSLIAEMPDIFKCPTSKSADKGMTVYQMPRGDSTLFPGSLGLNYRDVTDGTAKTICLVEVDEEHAVPWTKPDDWKFDPSAPSLGLGGHFQPKGKGFLAVIADRSVLFLSKDIPREDLIALFTRAAGDQVAFVEP